MIMLTDKYNKDAQRGMIRLNNRSLDKVRATLALIEQIDSQNVIVRSRGASGVMRKAAQYTYVAG
jgi:RNase P/RNase MRP subunit POP5